jgi:AAA15 family ATPase/GTPase
MLKSLTIVKYRQFEDFELPEPKQVNLIVGKNAVGKSAILDAIRLLLEPNKLYAIKSILIARDEYYGAPSQCLSTFNAYGNENEFHDNIISPIIHIKAFTSLSYTEPDTIKSYLDTDIKEISIQEGKSDFKSYSFEEFNNIPEAIEYRTKNRYVGMNSHQYKVYEQLWKDKRFTGYDQKIISLLQEILPELEDIDFTYSAVAKLKGINKQIPLGSLGEGFKRLFNLALQLVYAQNGILLIDEFEVGLHHSVQEQIWDATLMMSKELNVQVFATTHSQDCVYGYARALNKRNDIDGQAIRLEKHDDKIYATAMDKELLATIAETGTEIR